MTMRHCHINEPKSKQVQLVFKRAELIYDAENYSFIEGEVMQTDNEHARHQVFDIGQKGNIDRVSRILDLAFSECTEMLYPYTKEKIEDEQEALDNILSAPEEYVIDLTLPESFSVTTLKLLKKLIHEYLVCRIIEDWMSITNPKSQSNWAEKILYLKGKIKSSLVSRVGKVRRKLKPF